MNDLKVVRLTHKFAEMIDGVDLSPYAVGDIVTLSLSQARLLIAEGWAEPVREGRAVRATRSPLAVAADKPRARKRKRT